MSGFLMSILDAGCPVAVGPGSGRQAHILGGGTVLRGDGPR